MEQHILVDSSALIALVTKSDQWHTLATRYLLGYPPRRWVILSTVLAETLTWLRARGKSASALSLGEQLRSECHYFVLTVEDDRATWEAFCRYRDKAWSYTDCSLLAMSQRLGLSVIVSFDEDIRQMSGLGVICQPIIERR